MGTSVFERGSGTSGPACPPTSAAMAKSITRLLQHSILQLCNEHVGYSHKLQILGVLCMTVDDDQHELVVKVNNTLKRVQPPQKDSMAPAIPSIPTPALDMRPHHLHNGVAAVPTLTLPGLPTANPVIGAEAGDLTNEMEAGGSSTPNTRSSSPSSISQSGGGGSGGRRSHGRKRSKPVKVSHVYDEGEMINDDSDVLTVIPTDPDHPHDDAPTPKPVYPDELSDDDIGVEEEEEEEVLPKKKPRARPVRYFSPNKNASTASPNVRALLQQSIARHRAATSTSSPPPQDTSRPSQLRDALLNGAPSLTLPICVAPDQRPDGGAALLVDNDDDDRSGSLQIDEGDDIEIARDADTASDRNLDQSLASVKDEPKDDYDWSTAGQVSNVPQDLSSKSGASAAAATAAASSSYPSSPFSAYTVAPNSSAPLDMSAYSGLSLAFSTANLQIPPALYQGVNSSMAGSDGLSIKYTPTGPITVGANGKNVSQQKVKDIIMYDDQSPLSQQKGARLETDFMVDKMGVEGRKRRRRAPDETLTAEEIAEYMGESRANVTGNGRGDFRCKYCTVEVEDLVPYLQHTLAVHNAYICHQCGKSFTTKSSLLRHRPIHTGMRRFACSICKKTFYRKDKCKAHIKRHLGANGEIQAEVE